MGGTAAAAPKKAAAIEPAVEIDWAATAEAYWPFAAGAFVLVVAMAALKWRRARRVRALHENRRTQFGFAAIDPALVAQHRAAWESAPAKPPAAIDPSPIAPRPIAPMPPVSARRARMAQGSQQPPIANGVMVAPPQMPPPIDPRYAPTVMPQVARPLPPPPARAMSPSMVAPVAPRPAAMVMHPFANGTQGVPKVPAQYPLTFAAAELLARKTRRGHAAVDPYAAQAWEDLATEGDDPADTEGDFAIQFAPGSGQPSASLLARGSQNDELERARESMRETFVLPPKR